MKVIVIIQWFPPHCSLNRLVQLTKTVRTRNLNPAPNGWFCVLQRNLELENLLTLRRAGNRTSDTTFLGHGYDDEEMSLMSADFLLCGEDLIYLSQRIFIRMDPSTKIRCNCNLPKLPDPKLMNWSEWRFAKTFCVKVPVQQVRSSSSSPISSNEYDPSPVHACLLRLLICRRRSKLIVIRSCLCAATTERRMKFDISCHTTP